MAVKIADPVKRYSYLLGQTGLFKYLADIKVFHPLSFRSRQPQTVFKTACCAEYYPMRGLAFEMRTRSFLEESRVIVLIFSGWPIDSYSTTYPGRHHRYHYSTIIFICSQRVSTCRPLYLHRSSCLTYSRARPAPISTLSSRKHLSPTSSSLLYRMSKINSTCTIARI